MCSAADDLVDDAKHVGISFKLLSFLNTWPLVLVVLVLVVDDDIFVTLRDGFGNKYPIAELKVAIQMLQLQGLEQSFIHRFTMLVTITKYSALFPLAVYH